MTGTRWHYVIGDIHGCYEAYLRLERRIFIHAAKHGVRPIIVSVGDLVDRGPASAQVVAHFRKGQRAGTHRAVLGNHEVMMLEILHTFAPFNFEAPGCDYPSWLPTLPSDFARRPQDSNFMQYCFRAQELWMSQGGLQTLQSYGVDPFDPDTWHIPAPDLRYLLRLPLVYQAPGLVVTHALAKREDLQTVLHAELDILRREASESLLWNRKPLLVRPDEARVHVSGHTPARKVRRRMRGACIQIDTACCFGHRLTAYCPESKSYLSVMAERKRAVKSPG
jgi:serine/threonine protein phosphatase 1